MNKEANWILTVNSDPALENVPLHLPGDQGDCHGDDWDKPVLWFKFIYTNYIQSEGIHVNGM